MRAAIFSTSPLSSRRKTRMTVRDLTDHELLRRLRDLAARSANLEADLLNHLAEVDARELYLGEGCASMFVYCTEVLHFSEAAAYHRIQAARAARKFPVLLERVRAGELHVSGVKLLAPHLTSENHLELVDLSRHKSKRAVEELLADRAPKPEVPQLVRRLPVPPSTAPPPQPLGGERFKIQFTAGRALHEKLWEAQALLRHQIPDGDLEQVFERALTLLVEQVRRRKFAEVSRPAARGSAASGSPSRHIPAAIRRAVAARDGGRCAFVSHTGLRCSEAGFLEFHHKAPWARFRSHSVEEIELRCRAHNRYAATQDYGAAHMRRFRGGP